MSHSDRALAAFRSRGWAPGLTEMSMGQLEEALRVANLLGTKLEITDGALTVAGTALTAGGASEDAVPLIGADIDELGAGDFDGQTGIVRIGTYPDLHEVEFIWSDADATWIQAQEHVAMTQRDTWGMDLSNRALAAIRTPNWCRFFSGLPYGKSACTFLTSTQNLAALASNELAISNSADFAASGSVRIRDQVLTYTGKAAGKLTGVSAGTGTFVADHTVVTQGDVGGWGTTSIPLDMVDAMYAAGFTLEQRANAWLNGSHDAKTMSVAPFYMNVDSAESFSLPPNDADGLEIGTILTGPTADGGNNRNAERPFVWTDGGWEALGFVPDKRFLFPTLYGRMNDAAAADNGEVYGYTLRLRWVGTP